MEYLANFDCVVIPRTARRKQRIIEGYSQDMNDFLHDESLDEDRYNLKRRC
ncbi:hypothetical protein GCM10010913_41750 [Paenibacillus aceti]|uniref:Uncharacterized protein n=1 Tax=Paenibacillus aceti TaxID=1820010 RepID=A0ABQ1W680_9BACL|nr:hypothetical protein GCM10010913_41750 [Paenibacillus aceti]